MIPKDEDKKVEFDAGELSSAVRRAALLTNEGKGVRLAFDVAASLSSRAPEMGEAEIKVDAAQYGDPIEIGFNPVYLTERARRRRHRLIELKAPNKPGVIKVDGDFTYVVMPVNLSDDLVWRVLADVDGTSGLSPRPSLDLWPSASHCWMPPRRSLDVLSPSRSTLLAASEDAEPRVHDDRRPSLQLLTGPVLEHPAAEGHAQGARDVPAS